MNSSNHTLEKEMSKLPFKYTPPSKELFIRNRKNFADQMAPGHVAILYSNDLIRTNADGAYPFEQDSGMYYLSGMDQEECILLLFPDAPRPDWKEVLFTRKTDEHIQIWEGWKYSVEEAKEASGILNVKFSTDFDTFIRQIISHCEGIYLDMNEHERNALSSWTSAYQFAERMRREYPGHQIRRAAPILESLRALKSPEEITQIEVACNITDKAFRRVLGFVKPGVFEYEIEAEIQHEFLRNRATGPAYGSIIASGRNACVLHYVQNSAECKEGDLILMDFGSEYGNYSSDLSRTIPVSGRFTQRQKDVYNACLRVFKGAREMLVVGNYLEEYHKRVGELMTEELIALGLTTQEEVDTQNADWPAYKKYFMHGTSHFLGLDTHDVGNRYKPFKAGMVFTCEPGIYILEENMGVRIENDILITENGNRDLMENIPIEVDEIEALMNN